MTAARCTCGFAELADEELADHLLSVLRGLRYGACWTGTRDPAASTRLGATLARLRQEATLTTGDLAAATGLDSRAITDAEAGTWQDRHTWQRLDEALSAAGTLLHLHDHSYAPRPADADPSPADDRPRGRTAARRGHRFTRVTSEIRTRITAAEWAPGDRLPYLAELADDHDTTVTGVKIALSEAITEGLLIHRPRDGYYRAGQNTPEPRTITEIIVCYSDGTREHYPHPSTVNRMM